MFFGPSVGGEAFTVGAVLASDRGILDVSFLSEAATCGLGRLTVAGLAAGLVDAIVGALEDVVCFGAAVAGAAVCCPVFGIFICTVCTSVAAFFCMLAVRTFGKGAFFVNVFGVRGVEAAATGFGAAGAGTGAAAGLVTTGVNGMGFWGPSEGLMILGTIGFGVAVTSFGAMGFASWSEGLASPFARRFSFGGRGLALLS